jgi:hypothetical protein
VVSEYEVVPKELHDVYDDLALLSRMHEAEEGQSITNGVPTLPRVVQTDESYFTTKESSISRWLQLPGVSQTCVARALLNSDLLAIMDNGDSGAWTIFVPGANCSAKPEAFKKASPKFG